MIRKQNRSEKRNVVNKTFCLRPELWDYVEKKALAEDVSYSYVVNEIIRRDRDGEQVSKGE